MKRQLNEGIIITDYGRYLRDVRTNKAQSMVGARRDRFAIRRGKDGGRPKQQWTPVSRLDDEASFL